jgi:hypothetical protein
VAFEQGRLELLRSRQPVSAVLEGQVRLPT